MHVAPARLTPASLIAAATRASAPGSFLISMARSYGIDALLGRCPAPPTFSDLLSPRLHTRTDGGPRTKSSCGLGEPRISLDAFGAWAVKDSNLRPWD